MSGFTKSYRDKWQNPVFRNLLEAGIWSWMCDMAAWKETQIRFNGSLVKLERGQLVTSIRFIANGFEIGEQVTRCFLENLKNEGMVNTLTTHRSTIITICNYEKYQEISHTDNTLTNNHPTHSQHTANTHKKEYKKERKKEKEEPLPLIEIPPFVPVGIFDDFQKMRSGIKEPLSALAAKALFRKLEALEGKGYDAGLLLNLAIERGWLSVYEDESCKKPQKDGALVV